MGLDLFMAVASIVAAAVATWAILRLFLSEDDAAAPLQHSPNNESIENPTEDHVENPGRAINETHRNHIKRLIIAVILTIPTFITTMVTLAGITLPHWLTNPWLHAIIATPVMFYCAAPAHNHGTAALKKRTPNAASLLSLAMTIVYVYSLLVCVVSWIFPAINISLSQAWSPCCRWRFHRSSSVPRQSKHHKAISRPRNRKHKHNRKRCKNLKECNRRKLNKVRKRSFKPASNVRSACE